MKINSNYYWRKLPASLMAVILMLNLILIGNTNVALAEEPTESVVDEVYSVVDEVYNVQASIDESVIDDVYGDQLEESVDSSFTVTEFVYGLNDNDILESMLIDNQGNILFEGLIESNIEGQKVAVFRDVDSGEYILCTLINGVLAGMENINGSNGDVSHNINAIEITGKINGVAQGQTIEIFWEAENGFEGMNSSLQITSNGDGTPFTFKTGPGNYKMKIISENYQEHVSDMQVDASMDLGTIEMVPESNDGDDSSNGGDDSSNGGDDSSNGGDDSSNDGDDSSNDGDDSSNDGDDSSNDGGTSSGGSGSSSDQDNSTTFPDSEIDEAITNSDNDNVELAAPTSREDIQITGSQLSSLISAEKEATININGVKISFDPGQFEFDSDTTLKLSVNEVEKNEATKLIEGTEYNLVDNVYDFNMEKLAGNGVANKLDRFSKALSITIPVPETYWADNNHNRLEVFYFNDATEEWEPLNANHKADVQSLIFNTDHFSKYAVLEKPAVNFNDIQGHWAEEDIINMGSRGFVSGYKDGAFQPNVNITRAEFTAMLASVLGLDKVEFEGISFEDIDSENWYFKAIGQAYKAGIVQGYNDEKFKPNEYITREQMAAMIDNSMNYVSLPGMEQQGVLEMFLDNEKISRWSQSSVKRVVSVELIKGVPSNKGINFAPKELTSRAEATVVLGRFNMMLDTLK
ncbi:MAG: S-layer homology domain-containing protein [Firmicutes bacterium]|nr:S-layer homology domain-containing protein [Bacillota bacterium]